MLVSLHAPEQVRVDVERHDGPNVERVFKPVIVREVELDEAVGKFGGGRHIDLDLASKFSIAPGFIEDLVNVGLGQATQASLDLVAEKLKGDDGMAAEQMHGQA